MRLYSKEELNRLKEKTPKSIYNKINKINSFLDKDWNKYIEAIHLTNQGQTTWTYSISIADLKFFELTQPSLINKIKSN